MLGIMLLAAQAALYTSPTVDINQGVYICQQANRSTMDKLASVKNDRKRRGKVAESLGCGYHLGPATGPYQPANYRVRGRVAEACYGYSEGFCDALGYAVRIKTAAGYRVVISLWLDEDRD